MRYPGRAPLSPTLVTVIATTWAALLAMAESIAVPTRVLGEPPSKPHSPVPLGRALLIARLALLAIAGVTAGSSLDWWKLSLWDGAGAVGMAIALGYLAGEALPKTLGRLAPNLAAALVPVARTSLVLFRPLIGIVTGLDRGFHRALAPRVEPAGELGEPQQEMLAGVHSLRETTVADIMTPRLDIAAVEGQATWHEVVDQVSRSDHSRIPVYNESLDDLVGLLHVKDLAPRVVGPADPPSSWQHMLRPIRYVPEAKSLSDQLRDFQRGTAHLAIVVDEYGGTSGLVTLEDILEEIVGEIHDEHDVHEAPPIEQEGDERFWVDGRLPLDDLSDLLGSQIEHDDVSTVSGLVYTELGRVPRPGEELRINGFRVVVEQVFRRRIQRVYFERLEGGEESAPADKIGGES